MTFDNNCLHVEYYYQSVNLSIAVAKLTTTVPEGGRIMPATMDKTTTDEFAWADWIIEEREKHNWSRGDLARKIGSTRQTIDNYENRRRADPDLEILSRISKAFGYSALHLPRLAGLVPDDIKPDQETDDIIEALSDFSKREKQELLAYINFLKNQRKKK